MDNYDRKIEREARLRRQARERADAEYNRRLEIRRKREAEVRAALGWSDAGYRGVPRKERKMPNVQTNPKKGAA